MSELQIGLLLVGALVIIAVVVYNRVQEARFRERAESAFAPPAGDALLESAPVARERIEPQFQDEDASEPAALPDRLEPRAMSESPSIHAAKVAEAALKAHEEAALAESAAAPGARPSETAPAPAGAAVEADAPATNPAPVAPPPEQPAPAAFQPAQAPAAGDESLALIAYIVDVSAPEPLLPSVLDQLVRALGPLAARVQLLGRQKDPEAWTRVDVSAPHPVRELRGALQLVDRRGAITQQDLVIFQSAMARCAASSGASANIPDAAPALARTRELDSLCAEVDVVVGINLIAQPGRPLVGTRLRGLAESAGFRLERGAFVFPDGHGGARFTLEQQSGAPITPEVLRTLQTLAVTMLLDVPRQADGVAAFDQMVAVGRQLAQSLGASLVDDNQSPVSEAGLEQIRNQLRSIYKTMDAHGIPAGSPAALRLFG